MPNQTQNYLLASTQLSHMCFSDTTGTSSMYLKGAGGVSGDGFALPRYGYLTSLTLWDGTVLRTDVDEVSFNNGDRVSVYCQNTGTDFTVKVRLNGVSTSIQVSGVAHNSTLQAVLEFISIKE